MTMITHLRALQALELAIRIGSLKGAAEELGITPAAVGQRIRALEDYLATDLLVRGRSGLQPTAELQPALDDLTSAFAALERVITALDFQRPSEIHIVADPDWADLWLMPRLQVFREDHPNILFCINGNGDIPVRLGAPDIRVELTDGNAEPLFKDILLPVTGPDNPRRIADWDPDLQMEGMPLLHLKAQRDDGDSPGWVEWFEAFGYRERGKDRGVHYNDANRALEAVRENVGFLVCGLSLVLVSLDDGSIVTPFSPDKHLVSPNTYRMKVRPDAEKRPQLSRFLSWLRKEAKATEQRIDQFVDQPST